MSGVFHSLKTALPSFESSDNQGGGTEGQVGGSGGGGGASTNDKAKLGGGTAPTEQRTKLAAFLSSTSKGEYELKLDITAEEEVSTVHYLFYLSFSITFLALHQSWLIETTVLYCCELKLRILWM